MGFKDHRETRTGADDRGLVTPNGSGVRRCPSSTRSHSRAKKGYWSAFEITPSVIEYEGRPATQNVIRDITAQASCAEGLAGQRGQVSCHRGAHGHGHDDPGRGFHDYLREPPDGEAQRVHQAGDRGQDALDRGGAPRMMWSA
ncbi:MAG: hypothetical protein MZV70_37110 [Desulfobacterales bacterium]|nr:hypothetical protein [Desulfobacterales bacterium]